MSVAYNDYISTHRDCVQKAINYILVKIPSERLKSLFPELISSELIESGYKHDSSKYSNDEYRPYDNYFYGEKTDKVKKEFNYAWLHHIHNNPHHWQYWVLKEDDAPVSSNTMTVKCLEIPDNYIVEMIADWWSFSWKKYLESHYIYDLYEVFDWYDNHTDKIAMNPKSKEKVEALLDLIRNYL